MRRALILFMAMAFALPFSSATSLAAVPSESEIDQYTETIPTGPGDEPTGPGGGQSGNGSGPPVGGEPSGGGKSGPVPAGELASPVAPGTAAALAAQGRDGDAVADFSRESAPAGPSTGSGQFPSIDLGDGSAGPTSLISPGGDDGVNLLPPLIGLVAILLAVALLVRRRGLGNTA